MPELPFSVRPTFEQLPMPVPTNSWAFSETTRVKGVLIQSGLEQLPSGLEEPPEIPLHFLETNLNMAHGELLFRSHYPYDETLARQPVQQFRPHKRPLFYVVRYTCWRPGSDLGSNPGAMPLTMSLMIGCSLGDVRVMKPYPELRQTVALACASAVLGEHAGGEDRPMALSLVNNFRDDQRRYTESFKADTVAELADKLG